MYRIQNESRTLPRGCCRVQFQLHTASNGILWTVTTVFILTTTTTLNNSLRLNTKAFASLSLYLSHSFTHTCTVSLHKIYSGRILRSHQKMNATTIMCQLLWIHSHSGARAHSFVSLPSNCVQLTKKNSVRRKDKTCREQSTYTPREREKKTAKRANRF